MYSAALGAILDLTWFVAPQSNLVAETEWLNSLDEWPDRKLYFMFNKFLLEAKLWFLWRNI